MENTLTRRTLQRPVKSFVELWSITEVSPWTTITEIHFLSVLFSLFKEQLLKNPTTAKAAVIDAHFLWATEQKKW